MNRFLGKTRKTGLPAALVALAAILLSTASCGYHVAGSDTLLPKSIQTIAVPAFASNSNYYRLADVFPADIAREFATRTKYHVVDASENADAVLNGSISTVTTYPTISDPTTGRATSIGVLVVLKITLTQRATGRVLYTNPAMVVKSYYELASDQHQTFDETGPAFRRVSQQVARDVVAAVMDNF